MRVGGGMSWVVDGILWVMLALPSSRLLWKATVGGLVVSWVPWERRLTVSHRHGSLRG